MDPKTFFSYGLVFLLFNAIAGMIAIAWIRYKIKSTEKGRKNILKAANGEFAKEEIAELPRLTLIYLAVNAVFFEMRYSKYYIRAALGLKV